MSDSPTEGVAITHFIAAMDVERSRRFSTDVPAARPCLS